MKRNTIKWRIFKYNLLVIISFILFTTVVFNLVVRTYIEKDTKSQLQKIASKAEDSLLRRGPEFFQDKNVHVPPPKPIGDEKATMQNDFGVPNAAGQGFATATDGDVDAGKLLSFYFMLDRSLREPLSLLNASYVLIDSKDSVLTPPQEFETVSTGLMSKLKTEFKAVQGAKTIQYVNFSNAGSQYIAILKPVAQENKIGIGWIMIYSSIEKVNQLQLGVNMILLAILLLSAVVAALLSSLVAKRISEPFSTLNEHIGSIAERNFGNKLQVKVDDELKEFVSNINTMSYKLEQYDKAQKTFLQNASHEFRTPLMSIQSYAEGIKYHVVESDVAVDIILDETKRMTSLVTDLLYLSRLEAIEESYNMSNINVHDLLISCKTRTEATAVKNNVSIEIKESYMQNDAEKHEQQLYIYADEEKLSRALTNIIGNCIRFAQSHITLTVESSNSNNNSNSNSNSNTVFAPDTSTNIDEVKASNTWVQITISDDGSGINEDELPYIFDRFYKGTQGNFGLGLAITRNIIEKHNGTIDAYNASSGATFKITLHGGRLSKSNII